MASHSSLVTGTGTLCSHQPVIKHPSFVSGLCPPSLPCVQAVCPPRGTSLQRFISDGVVFQNPTGAGLPQKTLLRLHSGRGSEIVANHNTQLVPGFTILWHLCPNTSEHGYSLGFTGTFACGEAVWPLPNALHTGELLLPLWHTDCSDPAVCSGDSLFSLTRALPGTEF